MCVHMADRDTTASESGIECVLNTNVFAMYRMCSQYKYDRLPVIFVLRTHSIHSEHIYITVSDGVKVVYHVECVFYITIECVLYIIIACVLYITIECVPSLSSPYPPEVSVVCQS
jgi:hypothetical protein